MNPARPAIIPASQTEGAGPVTRIVGLGASAGGLAALESFLAAVQPHSGLAYVVVQHLDPTQKTLLAELLQRVTSMRVREAEQGMRIEPDSVFVIPPGTELRVADGRLNLSTPDEPRGMRLPINVLFSSLASVQGERAIAVLLSGMGSDGTPGLQAIKAVGGLTLVQDPETAQFDAMPRSAIDAGCADIVAAPEALPARLMDCVSEESDPSSEAPPAAPPTAPMQQIVSLLQQQTRHDFSLYKPSTLHRRVGRRMAIHGFASMQRYAAYLAKNRSEIDLLFRELLIGVTEFFRDPEAWKSLGQSVLPALLSARASEGSLRVWCIGCSTGEEPYSLAMLFQETLQHLPRAQDVSLQVFASDLNPEAIATARRGYFPKTIRDQVSPGRLARFFTETENGYRVHESLRDRVLFARHDVILDPPFTRLDLIICRNLLIYFDQALQRKLLPLFHYCLRDAGVLMLGSSETIGRAGHLFAAIDSRQRLYRRYGRRSLSGPEMLLHSLPPLSRQRKDNDVTPRTVSSPGDDTLQAAADHVLLQVYAPAAVVLNAGGDIVYISGRTGKYLEPAAGKANWNIHAMAREHLRAPIAAALGVAASRNEPVQLRGLQVETPTGLQPVDVTVQALQTPAALAGMTMVVFREGARESGGPGEDHAVPETAHEAEVQQYRDEILALRDDARATREQLQSSNEELQSTNEELQSANEELTTSKEEMQSMNEELQTINSELQSKLDDLALAQSDMKNVLNSIEIAVLFLDRQLHVRRYTDRAAKLISLREGDIGRPLGELSSILDYPGLDEDALATLRTLQVSEKQVLTSDERWFTVRIMPYHRLDDVIDGVVIIMLDITDTKRLEKSLRGGADPSA
ncbi:chemotaxis protein CheB [Chromatocurvus halotolerans]|uniref:chemotaxis protein CheB n=1 Tax=Chromatocurvus halotolerans TaxID=1132028 RepID=UPI00196B11B3|nr:chemotaxis protein CheB [Chromatocurvus halotolerans]